MRVPEYHLLGERCLERICVGGIDVTFEKIMQRAALTDKEAGEIAALAGYTENYRKVINYHEVMTAGTGSLCTGGQRLDRYDPAEH